MMARAATMTAVLLLVVAAGCQDATEANSGREVEDGANAAGRDLATAGIDVSGDAESSRWTEHLLAVRRGETEPTPSLELDFVAADEVVVGEERGAAVVDTATGKTAWRAFTCEHPQCAGKANGERPFLFAPKYDGVMVTENGRVRFPEATEDEMQRVDHPTCPACGRDDRTQRYDPPEVIARRRELMDELKIARQSYRDAKRAGQEIPGHVRTPTEIMAEMAALPQIYLLVD